MMNMNEYKIQKQIKFKRLNSNINSNYYIIDMIYSV